MAVSILLAVSLVGLCLLAGRLALAALGANRAGGLEGAVGFGTLTIAAGLLVRLPGRAATAAILIGLAMTLGALARLRARRMAGAADGRAEAWTPWAAPAAVAVLTILLAAVPFLLAGRGGILGEGIYTNDHAAQLYWADWLQRGFGPEPTAVAWGYPVGPQSLAAVLAEGTGANLVDAFNALLLAIPALTGLVALSLLGHLRAVPRVASATLAGLPFLGASFLAQSAFKETAMALFVLAFAAALALASERVAGAPPPLSRRAGAAAAAVIALAGVFAYSVPALAWFALIAPAWLAVAVVAGEVRIDWRGVGAALRRRRVALGVGALLVIGLAVLTAGRIADFTERIGEVSASTGRLDSPVFPGEVLGIWPEGDFRIVRGEVGGALLATALGAIALLAGAVVAARRGAYAVLAALVVAFGIYAGARLFSSIYVEAKALAVMAPLVVVVALGGLFAARGRGALALRALGVAFLAGGLISTFLALREAPLGFGDRGEELEELALHADGEPLVFLGVDRFAGYWLRDALTASPGGYVPQDVRARRQKVWQQGDAMDLDTLAGSRLDEFDFAITTAAAYQSTPPANMEEVARTPSYVLWERTGRTPRGQVLNENGAPGAILGDGDPAVGALACGGAERAPGGSALVLPEPVVGSPAGWSRPMPLEAPGRATQALELAPGAWQLSLQYHSEVDLDVAAEGLSAPLPASLVGMYMTAQGQSAFWPVGGIEVPPGGGRVEVAVSAEEPGTLERAVGATRRVWLGEVAATRVDPLAEAPDTVPLGAACGRYVDRYVPRARPGNH